MFLLNVSLKQIKFLLHIEKCVHLAFKVWEGDIPVVNVECLEGDIPAR